MNGRPSSRERLEATARGLNTTGESSSDLVGDESAVRGQNERDKAQVRTRQRGVFNGTNQRLEVKTKIDGHELRWFNEYPGRLQRAEAAGWEFVGNAEVSMAESNKVVERNSDVGDKIRAIVGVTDNNEPLYAYLMKIRKEWFDEDQQDALSKITESEKGMVRNQGMNADRVGETYLPDDRKQALTVGRGEFKRAW